MGVAQSSTTIKSLEIACEEERGSCVDAVILLLRRHVLHEENVSTDPPIPPLFDNRSG